MGRGGFAMAALRAAWASALLAGASAMPALPRSFVRLHTPTRGRYELQTADVSISWGEGSERSHLELLGTVHLAEPSYYASLVADTEDSDVVLVELITSRSNLEPDPNGVLRARAPMVPSASQAQLARRLGLAHQLEALPYGASARFSSVADVPVEDLSRG